MKFEKAIMTNSFAKFTYFYSVKNGICTGVYRVKGYYHNSHNNFMS